MKAKAGTGRRWEKEICAICLISTKLCSCFTSSQARYLTIEYVDIHPENVMTVSAPRENISSSPLDHARRTWGPDRTLKHLSYAWWWSHKQNIQAVPPFQESGVLQLQRNLYLVTFPLLHLGVICLKTKAITFSNTNHHDYQWTKFDAPN